MPPFPDRRTFKDRVNTLLRQGKINPTYAARLLGWTDVLIATLWR
jgi:hypothetical protein